MNKLKFKDFFKLKTEKKYIDYTTFFLNTKSHQCQFTLRGKVGQLRKRKRVLCLSILLVYMTVTISVRMINEIIQQAPLKLNIYYLVFMF